MSDEPIYCMRCGAEEATCEHWNLGVLFYDQSGPYCEICGLLISEPVCEFADHQNESAGSERA